MSTTDGPGPTLAVGRGHHRRSRAAMHPGLTARGQQGPPGIRATLPLRVAVLCAALAAACADAEPEPPPAPGEPLAGLNTGERGRFLVGRALFERLATADEGLGPLYNGERCSDCHDQPVTGGSGIQRLRVLKATRFEDGRCDLLRAVGGDNIQRRATDLLKAHGMGPEEVPEAATATALMTGPPLLGLGLLEAVPEAVLEEWADPDDSDGDGISGRLPRLADGRGARFGRKGDASTVADFVDTALRFELGFTTHLHPAEEPRNGTPVPPEADPMADPEIDARTLGQITDFVRFLAPPAPEQELSAAARDTVERGKALFSQIGCTSCHREELRTGESATAALAGRTLRPYSDMLLHDLGEELADVCGADAAPGELRTAPLWGLRHRARLLHDGRAADIGGAVAAHGGEAESAREAFRSLPEEARLAVIRFLRSL
ncbi:MAG: c-type cytochrome [Gemmatimonadetes bacterium]|nr:c-type cytochrome [Gemmatimonadota bacterium]